MSETNEGGWSEIEILESEPRIQLRGYPVSTSFRSIASISSFGEITEGSGSGKEDEIQLQWAAIERLPTFRRMRSALLDVYVGGDVRAEGKRVVDVAKLSPIEQHLFVENLIKNVEEDNRQFNGYKLQEFVPEKTAAYISQYDLHIP